MHRTFIAINLPQRVKDELERVLASFKKDLKRAPIKWTAADKIHITLHFLGNLADKQVEEAGDILAKIAPKYGKFKIKLGQIGFFPHRLRPRVVFVDTDCPDEIGYLQAEIGKELEKLGYQIDSRPWHPHLTLGRVNGSVHAETFEKQEICPLEFEAESVELMESELGPDGAKYSVLKSFPLK
jgi:2'-5' RNA ligase